MTIQAAARKFGVSTARVRKLVRDGRIRGVVWHSKEEGPVAYWEIPDDLRELPVLDGPGSSGRGRPVPKTYPIRGLEKPPASRGAR